MNKRALSVALITATVMGLLAAAMIGPKASAAPTTSTTSTTASAASAPSEKDFMKVMQDRCVRCHSGQCASVDALVKVKWLTPGDAEASKVYTIIGKHKNPAGTYHNVSDNEKAVIHDFVQSMAAASQPAGTN